MQPPGGVAWQGADHTHNTLRIMEARFLSIGEDEVQIEKEPEINPNRFGLEFGLLMWIHDF